MKRLRWTEQDLRRRGKSDPGKLRIAARLRRETILSLKSMAGRVGLGSSKSANANLHTWMQADGKPDGAMTPFTFTLHLKGQDGEARASPS